MAAFLSAETSLGLVLFKVWWAFRTVLGFKVLGFGGALPGSYASAFEIF